MESEEARQEGVDFIELELIPDMVDARCFCEPSSREFVEFVSATARLDEISRTSEIYRVEAVVRFSGEACSFSLLVKLLPQEAERSRTAFDAYQNEEMFYTKMTLKYGSDLTPRCYLADLGRYGRAVVVLEDLQEAGYAPVDGVLDKDHLKLCVQVLGKFHGRGLRLKATEPEIFREFEAKLLETILTEESMRRYESRSSRMMDVLESMPDSRFTESAKKKLNESPIEIVKAMASMVDEVSTICHGHFSHDNLLFKYQNGKPTEAKVIDWQTMRYCSPAVDLGPILLYNMEQGSGPSELQEILTVYVDAVRSEYPEIAGDRLREEVVDKFLFAGLILSLQEHITDEELTGVIFKLERLIAFH